MGQSIKIKTGRLGFKSLTISIAVQTVQEKSYSMMKVTHQQNLISKKYLPHKIVRSE